MYLDSINVQQIQYEHYSLTRRLFTVRIPRKSVRIVTAADPTSTKGSNLTKKKKSTTTLYGTWCFSLFFIIIIVVSSLDFLIFISKVVLVRYTFTYKSKEFTRLKKSIRHTEANSIRHIITINPINAR